MRLLLTAFSILLLVQAAHAQSVNAPDLSVGDSWKRSNGLEIKVAKVDDTGFQIMGFLLTCPTCIYHMDRNLTILNVTHEDGQALDVTKHGFIPLGSEWKFLDFPLEMKKRWRMTPTGWFQGTQSRYTIESNVTAFEDVKTKAGVFKAYQIRQDYTLHHQGGSSGWTSRLWYSPDVKANVKFVSGSRGGQDWDLVSYDLKK